MSNNESLTAQLAQFQKQNSFEGLPTNVKNNLSFILRNPNNTKVVYLEDASGISDKLFTSISKIDTTKGFLNNALNGLIKPNDPLKFYAMYPEYGMAFQGLLEAIKKVEQLGYDIAAALPTSTLRNKTVKFEINKRKAKTQPKTADAKQNNTTNAPAAKTSEKVKAPEIKTPEIPEKVKISVEKKTSKKTEVKPQKEDDATNTKVSKETEAEKK
jgi:hypothetical protein